MEGAEASSSFCPHYRRTVKWTAAYQSGVEMPDVVTPRLSRSELIAAWMVSRCSRTSPVMSVPCTPGAVFHSIDVAARQHPCDRGAMQSRPVEHHPFPFDHYLFVDAGHASPLIVQ